MSALRNFTVWVLFATSLARVLPKWNTTNSIYEQRSTDQQQQLNWMKNSLLEEQQNLENLEEAINEDSGLFEGDIAGINSSELIGRNAIIDFGRIWTDGIIPYEISRWFSPSEQRSIEEAFHEYHYKTCLRFVPRTTQKDYITIIRGKGCYSQVGRKGIGNQEVSLGIGCMKKRGVILHELMHVAGFWHEQSRADRDDFVIINWKNIKKGMEVNFNKYPWTEIQHLNETYDVASVMHYGPHSFAKNRHLNTIEPKDPQYGRIMGQREGFSEKDILKINKLYHCDGKNITEIKQGKKKKKPNALTDFLKLFWKYLSSGS